MSKAFAYAAPAVGKPLAPRTIDRREPGADDVAIDIQFSGICHSDIHQARDEWGNGVFPMVPGHEIVGVVTHVGPEVTRLAVGDRVGVGCMVDSCRACSFCKEDLEQFCEKGAALTYNSTEMDRKTPTYGGYATNIVVRERFVLKIPKNLDMAGAAPLLCAGITTYSPLRQWGVKKGDRVGVVGLGGLGHMAVKLAHSMGADVTVFSTSDAKAADAKRLGAKDFIVTKDPTIFNKIAASFDVLIDSVSASHDYNTYLGILRPRGVMVLVGAPPEPTPLAAFAMIGGAKRLAGSAIGGVKETQEMLDYCGEHNIVSDIEIIPVNKVNEAYERMMRGDVRYRFVIDMATLKA